MLILLNLTLSGMNFYLARKLAQRGLNNGLQRFAGEFCLGAACFQFYLQYIK